MQWLDGLANQLEMGEFQAFWRSAAGGGDAGKPAIELLKLTGFADAVRKQYKQLVLRLHPDKCSHERAREAFDAVHSAYAKLAPQQ